MHTLLRCALLVTLTVGPVFAQSPADKASLVHVQSLLQRVGEPLYQILAQRDRAGNVYQTLDSTILPEEQYIRVTYHMPGRSDRTYVLYRDQLLRQLGTSSAWLPLQEGYQAEALRTMERVLTAANARNLADWLAAPQDSMTSASGNPSPETSRTLASSPAIADQKGGDFSATSSHGIRVEGRKRPDSLAIESLEEFLDGRLSASATAEPATAAGFVPPEITRFTEVTINHQRRNVQETIITKDPSPTGLVVDVSGDRLWVLGVRPDSPAARAGIRGGDEIVRFHGEPVNSLNLAAVVPKFRTLPNIALVEVRPPDKRQ